MKLYINSAKENWVVDRFIKEWNSYNFKQSRDYRFGNKIICTLDLVIALISLSSFFVIAKK